MNKIQAGNLTRRGAGRPPGSPNKVPSILKEAILRAGEEAGGEEGLVGYLTTQAKTNPAAFMTLLGKVLPLQVGGEGGEPITTVTRIILTPAEFPS